MSEFNTPPKVGYSVSEGLHASGLGRTSFYALIKSGQLRSVKLGGRRIIPASALVELIEGPADTDAVTNGPGPDTPAKVAHSIPEAITASGLGKTSLYALIESGQLRSVKLGGRRIIPASALVELIEGGAADTDTDIVARKAQR